MSKFENIDLALSQHAASIAQLEQEIGLLKADEVYQQNDTLRKQLTDLENRLNGATKQLTTFKAENKRLKNELYEQLFNEKAKLVNVTDKRLDAYFEAQTGNGANRLVQFENHVKQHIQQITGQLQKNQVNLEHSVYAQLNNMQLQATEAVAQARQQAEEARRELLRQKAQGIQSLRAEPLTEEQMIKRSKQNHLESFLGLKLFNVLGILLIIVGVIAAVQFSYAYIPDVLKSTLAYLLGVGMLLVGERMNRKRPNVFSLGLTAGGIAILYASTALSFFLLQILSIIPALLVCVLTTGLAFVLSQRYDSQTIAVFAVVGGYLPILSIDGNGALVYYSMGYFLLLNGFSLLVSVYKKWQISHYVSFFLNLGATFYLLALLRASSFAQAHFFAVGYTFLSFMIYTAIPVLSSYKTNTKLKRSDNVLLILNTVLGSLLLFFVFGVFGLWNGAGAMAIVFCLFYLLSARIVEKKLSSETTSQALFYITGLTFAVLAVPIQLGAAYLSLGWLVQGTFLLCYGIWSEKKTFTKSGIVVSALCLLTFFTFDLLLSGPLFFSKYMSITLAAALITTTLTLKKKAIFGVGRFFKCATIVNGWFFLLSACGDKLQPFLRTVTDSGFVADHFAQIAAILIGLCYAYWILRIRPLSDRALPWISTGIYVISILNLLVLNGWNGRFYAESYSIGTKVVGTIFILVINVLAVLAMRELVLRLTLGRQLGSEWYPLILSAFFVFVLTQNLIVVFDLSLNNILITAVLAATALLWILFGFAKRYLYIRISGLGLSFLTVIKLFVIDLGFLTEGMRIVSYFMMGAALLAISFVYQHFNKKLDAGTGGEP